VVEKEEDQQPEELEPEELEQKSLSPEQKKRKPGRPKRIINVEKKEEEQQPEEREELEPEELEQKILSPEKKEQKKRKPGRPKRSNNAVVEKEEEEEGVIGSPRKKEQKRKSTRLSKQDEEEEDVQKSPQKRQAMRAEENGGEKGEIAAPLNPDTHLKKQNWREQPRDYSLRYAGWRGQGKEEEAEEEEKKKEKTVDSVDSLLENSMVKRVIEVFREKEEEQLDFAELLQITQKEEWNINADDLRLLLDGTPFLNDGASNYRINKILKPAKFKR
jgi:hypothetical protein